MREAIDVMTAWATGGDEHFAVNYYTEQMDRRLRDGESAGRDRRLATLCRHLLTLRANEIGVLEHATLKEMARLAASS